MKPIHSALWLFLFVFFLAACKKNTTSSTTSYTCTSCKKTPDAVAANDANSKGVYKGVVVGSTGTVMFDVLNSGNTITATLIIDGTSIVLTSDVSWNSGQSYVAPFTGILNGSPVSITFQVDQDGGNPTVTSSDIPGHPGAQFELAKETSTSLIESFEGTYSTTKPEKGTFNLLLSRTLLRFGGIDRKDGETSMDHFDGTITPDGKLMQDGDTYIGTLNGDAINGSFKDSDGITVTVAGKRTL